jgi:hypothetical protein
VQRDQSEHCIPVAITAMMLNVSIVEFPITDAPITVALRW